MREEWQNRTRRQVEHGEIEVGEGKLEQRDLHSDARTHARVSLRDASRAVMDGLSRV